MARSYGTATLTLTVTESITLNSKDEGQTHSHTIASVSDIYRRTESIPTSDTAILAFSDSAIGKGQFVEGDVKYLRITNLDDTNYVALFLKNENSDEVCIKIDKGQSFIICPDLADGVVNVIDAVDNDTVTKAGLGDLTEVRAEADTAAVDIEIYMALT